MKEKCPHCKAVLVLRPVSSMIDKTGEKYGAYLACKKCGWHDWNYFVDVSKSEEKVEI